MQHPKMQVNDVDPTKKKPAYAQGPAQGKIRFEMPWPAFCGGCERHLNKGKRFNAEKKQVGMYYSTKLWSFAFNCPTCSYRLVMGTDPQNRDYKCISGMRRKNEGVTQARAAMNQVDEDSKLRGDALYKLEKKRKDLEEAERMKKELRHLKAIQGEDFSDDYQSSRDVRRIFRTKKKADKAELEEQAARGIHVPLLPTSELDCHAARQVAFQGSRAKPPTARLRLQSSSIFGSSAASGALVKARRQGLRAHSLAPVLGVTQQRKRKAARRPPVALKKRP